MKILNKILDYSILTGIFIVPFIAFIVPTDMFFPFITGKGFFFRILVDILFGLYVILAFVDPIFRPKFSWITKAVLLFSSVILLADLLGVSVYKSLWSNYERMEGFVLILHLVLYYFVASSVLNTKLRWKNFFNVSIVGSVLMSFHGILQLMGKADIHQGTDRIDASFGNASYFAIYLVFHIFLSLYMFVSSEATKFQKWLYGSVALLELIILYYTATRGAILGIIGGLFLTGLLILFKEKENKSLRKIGYTTVAVVFVIIASFILLKNTSFVKTNPILGRFSSLSLSEFKTQGRYFVWPMAVKGITERPILGWGQENFNFVFNKYYDPGMFGQEEWFDRTHNMVLDWFIAGGLLGFLAYVSMYVALLYYIWRKESTLKLTEKSILTGMVAAYVFHNMFVFDNLISYILFFSTLAFVSSLNSENVNREQDFYKKVFHSDVINYGVIPGALVGTVFLVYLINVPALQANTTLIQAISPQKEGPQKNIELFKKIYSYKSFGSTEATEQLVTGASQIAASQVPENIKKEFFDLAKEKVEKKIEQSPNDARYLVFAGSFYNRFNDTDSAIKYLERALKESPNKQSIYFELGSSYLTKGMTDKAFSLFKKAYDLKPTSKESQIIYAAGAIYTKNAKALAEIAPYISNETVVSDDRFLRAYLYIGDTTNVVNILNARLEKDPKNRQTKLSLASVYMSLGQKDKAISYLRSAINDDPSFKDQGEYYINQILQGN